MNSWFQVQIEEDSDGSIRQSWKETRVVCGLWYNGSDEAYNGWKISILFFIGIKMC